MLVFQRAMPKLSTACGLLSAWLQSIVSSRLKNCLFSHIIDIRSHDSITTHNQSRCYFTISPAFALWSRKTSRGETYAGDHSTLSPLDAPGRLKCLSIPVATVFQINPGSRCCVVFRGNLRQFSIR